MRKIYFIASLFILVNGATAQCPTLSINAAPASICSGGSSTLMGSGATTYTWSTNAGGVQSSTVSVSPGVTTTYTLYGTSSGCTDSTSITVSVSPNPTISILANPTVICQGNSTTLSASGATTYNWAPSTGLSSTTGASVSASPVVSTTYTVTGSNGACSNTATITINVAANPTVTTVASPTSICSGQTATLTASGAMTYTWAPGGVNASNFAVSPGSSTNFTLCGANASGCVSCTNVFISVTPTPTLTVSGNTNICNGTSTTLTVTGATSYVWMGGTTTQTITVSPNGTTGYTVTGTNGNCTSGMVATVIVQDSCIWPGDADEDLTVTNNDLLPIGLKYGMTGPARATTTTSWSGYPCTNWTDTLASGVNIKYVDCNGDGTIDNSDTLAIYANYSQTHPARYAGQNSISSGNPDIFLQYNKSLYLPGDTVLADVYIGSSTSQQTNFYGAAFTIDYDEASVVSGSEKFSFNNSWVGTINSNLLKFGNINSSSGFVDASLVRTDHLNTSGNGKIAQLSLILKSTLTANELHFTIKNTNKVDNVGMTGTLNAGTDSVTLVAGTMTVKQATEKQLHIYPNPATTVLNIDHGKNENAEIKMTDMLGKEVKYDVVYLRNGITGINVSSLANGIYFIQVKANENTFTKKIVVNR